MKWSEFKTYVDGQLAAQGREDAEVWKIAAAELQDGLTAADLRLYLDENGLDVGQYPEDEL